MEGVLQTKQSDEAGNEVTQIIWLTQMSHGVMGMKLKINQLVNTEIGI
jgi:hypothetical protein